MILEFAYLYNIRDWVGRAILALALGRGFLEYTPKIAYEIIGIRELYLKKTEMMLLA